MKRLFISLICVCILAVAFTTVAFAADISKATVSIAEPVLGEKPSTTATLPETASSYVKSVEWKGNFDENGCFKAGEMYEVHVDLGVKKDLTKYLLVILKITP